MTSESLEELQEHWRYLYQEYLPTLAKAKDEAQPKWPVQLDHCFTRIVLDNVIGVDKPWTEVIKSPAIKNMSEVQLRSVIALAEALATGESNLVELDERSLELRGKQSKQNKKRKPDENAAMAKESSKKSKTKDNSTVSSYFLPSPQSPAKKLTSTDTDGTNDSKTQNAKGQTVDMSFQLRRIKDSNITAFRKQTLTVLCEIPPGRYSTYGAMSDYISKTSHKTCARAVGNAMRNNPFAPEVPCHRILAGDGTLGGFKGSWGEEGQYASLKHELLDKEGVKFDSNGKVKGPPFRDFKS